MRSLLLITCILSASTAMAKPSIEIGRLTAPSRAPAASIAARYLQKTRAGAYELERASVSPVGDGVVVRYRQRHAGVPVIGGSVVVRIDGHGVVRRVASSLFDVAAVDVKPQIDRNAAIVAAKTRARSSDAGQAVLAIAPGSAGGARLVYAVRFAPVPQLLENAIYFVDARDGRVLKRLDLLRYGGMARVFQKNPVSAGGQTTALAFPDPFTPTDVAGGNTNGTLTSPLLQGWDCVDAGQSKAINMGGVNINVHICTITQEAKSTTQDFTTYMPQTEPAVAPADGCPGKNGQPLDEFSEQHMYWHVANTYAFFRSMFATLGTPDFKLRITAQMNMPLPVAVNLCTINLSTLDFTGPLVPFDNAFYSPGAGNPIADLLINGQDSIMFGQGSVTDFAYDGDVISHEFTHAVIDTLGKLNPPGFEDSQGLNDDPGAMNEGLADFFSSALGGDPLVGEYGGKNIPGNSAAEGAVRDLTNTDVCADDRWGEVHQDSQAFSASLWGARVAIAGDPKSASFDAAKATAFDTAVLAAIQSFPDQVDMPTAATAIASEVEMRLDAAAKASVESSFGTHKLLPTCDHVITWTGSNKKDVLFLDGTDSANAPMGATKVPGYVQWKIDVPADADSITVTTTLQAQSSLFGGGSAPALSLVAGPTGMPIVWTAGSDNSNAAASADFSGTSGQVTATLSGLVPGATAYVMIVNAGGSIIGRNITFDTTCSLGAGLCMPPDMAMAKPDNGGGCKCSLGGHGAAGGLGTIFFALVALALIKRAASRRWR